MTTGATLRAQGELDLAAVSRLRQEWYAVAEAGAGGVLEVDLTGVTFADASFVGLLVGLRNRRLRSGGSVRLTGVPPGVLRLLHLTGLLAAFPPEGPVRPDAAGVVDLRPLARPTGAAPGPGTAT